MISSICCRSSRDILRSNSSTYFGPPHPLLRGQCPCCLSGRPQSPHSPLGCSVWVCTAAVAAAIATACASSVVDSALRRSMSDFAACNGAVECTLAANSSTSYPGFVSISGAVVGAVFFFFMACELLRLFMVTMWCGMLPLRVNVGYMQGQSDVRASTPLRWASIKLGNIATIRISMSMKCCPDMSGPNYIFFVSCTVPNPFNETTGSQHLSRRFCVSA